MNSSSDKKVDGQKRKSGSSKKVSAISYPLITMIFVIVAALTALVPVLTKRM